MIPEAEAILRVFRLKPRPGSHVEIMDFGEAIMQDARLTREQFLAGLEYLRENKYTESGPIGEFLTPECVRYLEEAREAFEASEFAYETHLRDFLAKNLSVIESGLRLFGIEFPAGGRFIDILAVDTQNRLVVVELKVSKGYDRAVGQLLRYMGWVKKHLAEPGQLVRGVIVAREISDDLRYACACVPAVALLEYQLSVAMRQVEPADRMIVSGSPADPRLGSSG